MKKLYLQCPWRMNYDEAIGKYELENCQAGLYYQIQSPSQSASFGDWLDHIERTANVGFSQSYYTLMGEFDGKYWKTGSAGNSGPAQVASAGSGGTSAPSSNFTYPASVTVSAGQAYTSGAPVYFTSLNGLGQQVVYYGTNVFVGTGAPHRPTELKSEAMVAGEIIAWRAWKVVEGGLASVVAEVKPWSATEPMVGDPASGYGVHAYKGPHGPLLDGYVSASSSEKWVIGEVALWGDVIEHEEGYRAEFARVHSLVTWSAGVSEAQRELIKTAYLTHCPVHKIDDAA